MRRRRRRRWRRRKRRRRLRIRIDYPQILSPTMMHLEAIRFLTKEIYRAPPDK